MNCVEIWLQMSEVSQLKSFVQQNNNGQGHNGARNGSPSNNPVSRQGQRADPSNAVVLRFNVKAGPSNGMVACASQLASQPNVMHVPVRLASVNW